MDEQLCLWKQQSRELGLHHFRFAKCRTPLGASSLEVDVSPLDIDQTKTVGHLKDGDEAAAEIGPH